MSKLPLSIAILLAPIGLITSASAQILLTGTSYTQNFNLLASGLPDGWTVSIDAKHNLRGNESTFITTPIAWGASRDTGGVFRNTSSNTIALGSNTTAQSNHPDRALGWRPGLAAERDGAITVAFANTSGFQNFSVSMDVFTFNDVNAVAIYAFEYRVGTSGSFTQLGSTYTTGEPFSAKTFSFSSTALATVANQSQPVYFRLRGTTPTGTESLDGIAIDNFVLGYSVIASPVPEPSAVALLVGAGALLTCLARRAHRRHEATCAR